MSNRKSLSQKTRFEVFKRDSFRCQYCGRCPPAVVLQVDHFIPVAEGGENDVDNLMTSCADCNQGKGAGDITALPDTVAEKMRKRQEAAEQLRVYNEYLMEDRSRQDDAIERLGIVWFNKFKSEKDQFVFGDARAASVRIFLRSLTEAEILDAIEMAFSRTRDSHGKDDQTWKYFCGICWKKIKTANT